MVVFLKKCFKDSKRFKLKVKACFKRREVRQRRKRRKLLGRSVV